MAYLPHDTRVIEALDRADAARVRLADAIAASDEATKRAAEHATEAIVALIPRFTDPEEHPMTDIDINIAATSTCPRCGRYGRGHAGFAAADGSHSWRGFAICPGCGTTEEF